MNWNRDSKIIRKNNRLDLIVTVWMYLDDNNGNEYDDDDANDRGQ